MKKWADKNVSRWRTKFTVVNKCPIETVLLDYRELTLADVPNAFMWNATAVMSNATNTISIKVKYLEFAAFEEDRLLSVKN